MDLDLIVTPLSVRLVLSYLFLSISQSNLRVKHSGIQIPLALSVKPHNPINGETSDPAERACAHACSCDKWGRSNDCCLDVFDTVFMCVLMTRRSKTFLSSIVVPLISLLATVTDKPHLRSSAVWAFPSLTPGQYKYYICPWFIVVKYPLLSVPRHPSVCQQISTSICPFCYISVKMFIHVFI